MSDLPLPVLDLGLAPYEPLQQLQARLRRAVADGQLAGALLLLEHPPVITLGSRGGPADLRPNKLPPGAERMPVLYSERGGAATLHAPGQLVSYPVLPLPGRNLHSFVRGLEEVLIVLLHGYGVEAERWPKKPGLYVSGAKIASLGLRCERWVASHGSSLNVSIDLRLFDRIVSCGEEGLHQTSILGLTGRAPPMEEVKEGYRHSFVRVFARPLAPTVSLTPLEVEAYLGLSSPGG